MTSSTAVELKTSVTNNSKLESKTNNDDVSNFHNSNSNKSKTKFSSRNLNSVHKAPVTKLHDTTSGFSAVNNRMLVLRPVRGALATTKATTATAPTPINTPSLRKESMEQDAQVALVSSGRTGWSGQSPESKPLSGNKPSSEETTSTTPAQRQLQRTQQTNVWSGGVQGSPATTLAQPVDTMSPLRLRSSSGRWGDDAVEEDLVLSDIQKEMERKREFPDLGHANHMNPSSHRMYHNQGMNGMSHGYAMVSRYDRGYVDYHRGYNLSNQQDPHGGRYHPQDVRYERMGMGSGRVYHRSSHTTYGYHPHSRYEEDRRHYHSHYNDRYMVDRTGRYQDHGIYSNVGYQTQNTESYSHVDDRRSSSFGSRVDHHTSSPIQEEEQEALQVNQVKTLEVEDRKEDRMDLQNTQTSSSESSASTDPQQSVWQPSYHVNGSNDRSLWRMSASEVQSSSSTVEMYGYSHRSVVNPVRILKRNGPRMLFDPKSGTMINVDEKEEVVEKVAPIEVEKSLEDKKNHENGAVDQDIDESKAKSSEEKAEKWPSAIKTKRQSVSKDSKKTSNRGSMRTKMPKVVIAYRPVSDASEEHLNTHTKCDDSVSVEVVANTSNGQEIQERRPSRVGTRREGTERRSSCRSSRVNDDSRADSTEIRTERSTRKSDRTTRLQSLRASRVDRREEELGGLHQLQKERKTSIRKSNTSTKNQDKKESTSPVDTVIAVENPLLEFEDVEEEDDVGFETVKSRRTLYYERKQAIALAAEKRMRENIQLKPRVGKHGVIIGFKAKVVSVPSDASRQPTGLTRSFVDVIGKQKPTPTEVAVVDELKTSADKSERKIRSVSVLSTKSKRTPRSLPKKQERVRSIVSKSSRMSTSAVPMAVTGNDEMETNQRLSIPCEKPLMIVKKADVVSTQEDTVDAPTTTMTHSTPSSLTRKEQKKSSSRKIVEKKVYVAKQKPMPQHIREVETKENEQTTPAPVQSTETIAVGVISEKKSSSIIESTAVNAVDITESRSIRKVRVKTTKANSIARFDHENAASTSIHGRSRERNLSEDGSKDVRTRSKQTIESIKPRISRTERQTTPLTEDLGAAPGHVLSSEKKEQSTTMLKGIETAKPRRTSKQVGVRERRSSLVDSNIESVESQCNPLKTKQSRSKPTTHSLSPSKETILSISSDTTQTPSFPSKRRTSKTSVKTGGITTQKIYKQVYVIKNSTPPPSSSAA